MLQAAHDELPGYQQVLPDVKEARSRCCAAL